MPKQEPGNPRTRAESQAAIKKAAMEKAEGRQRQHAEAYMLMKYRSDDNRDVEEVVWNSRDGVTPFIITMRDGSEGSHVDWRNDEYAPDHQPKIGDRVFVDLTLDRAREFAAERAQHLWESEPDNDLSYSARDQFESQEAFAAMLMEGLEVEVENGAPMLVEVTEETCKQYGWKIVHPAPSATEQLAALKQEAEELKAAGQPQTVTLEESLKQGWPGPEVGF